MKELIKRIITEIDNTMFTVDLGLNYEDDGTITENESYQQLALIIGGLLTPSKFYREDTSEVQNTPARQLAVEIISSVPVLDVAHGDEYYEYEDLITTAVNDWFKRQEFIPEVSSISFVQRVGSIVTDFKVIREERELRVQDLHDFINDTISAFEKES